MYITFCNYFPKTVFQAQVKWVIFPDFCFDDILVIGLLIAKCINSVTPHLTTTLRKRALYTQQEVDNNVQIL